jgi:hypothetical protein
VGDQVRQSTSVSLRRTGDRTYECLSDVSATISLPGRRATVLRAAPSRLLATSTARDGWVDIQIPPGEDAVEIVWCEE